MAHWCELSTSGGPPRTPADPCGPPRTRTDSRGPPWIPVDPRGPSRTPADPPAPRGPAAPRGSPRTGADPRGPPRTSTDLRGPGGPLSTLSHLHTTGYGLVGTDRSIDEIRGTSHTAMHARHINTIRFLHPQELSPCRNP
eukprot:6103796-Prymnesium_polylepis.1